jgi:hypothetical protein
MISSEKLMVTIAWNPDGLHVIEVLPKGQGFDADYHCSSALTQLLKITRQFRNETRENRCFMRTTPVLIPPSQALSSAPSET